MSIRHTLICNGNPWIALCKRILSECILSLHLQVYVKPWKEKINQYDNTTNSRLWLQKMACLQSRPVNPLKHLAHHEMKKCNKESWNLLSSWILYQPRVWTFSAFKNCSNCSLQCLQTVFKKRWCRTLANISMYQFFLDVVRAMKLKFGKDQKEIQMYHFQHLAICLCSTFNETLD